MRLAQPSPPFSRSASNVWPALPCLKPSFNLRPTLDAGKTSAGRTRVFPRIKRPDWLRNGLLIVRALHYGQDFSCGELQASGKKWHGCPTWQHVFGPWKFSRGQVYWAISNPWSRNLASGELQLQALLLLLWLGRFLGIIGWDPSVGKSDRWHVDNLWFFYINLRYIPYIPLKWSVILMKSWTSTGYFSTSSSVPNCRFSMIIGCFIIIIILLPSCPTYQLLPQINLSWAEILRQPLHFFVVV